ncbi:MAG: DUF3332 family protein [Myxococcales bacterium]|nr:MAG: DUF3332 family protein [Myxococcales bacterium]
MRLDRASSLFAAGRNAHSAADPATKGRSFCRGMGVAARRCDERPDLAEGKRRCEMTFPYLRSKWIRNALFPVLLVGVLPLSTASCIGRFELTRKVYQFNREVDPNKWIQWLAFLVLNVVPVYGFAVLIDAVFANSVEFWTGDNPVTSDAGSDRRIVHGPGGEVVRMTRLAPGVMDVDMTGPGGAATSLILVLEENAVAAYDRAGVFMARVGDLQGMPALLDGAIAAR